MINRICSSVKPSLLSTCMFSLKRAPSSRNSFSIVSISSAALRTIRTSSRIFLFISSNPNATSGGSELAWGVRGREALFLSRSKLGPCSGRTVAVPPSVGSISVTDAVDSVGVRMCGGLYTPCAWNLGCDLVVPSSHGGPSGGLD